MPISKPLATAIAVLFYIIFLVANLPANQVIPRLPLPQNLSVNGISGSIWNGHANTVFASGIRVYNVEWSLSPWSLLIGNLSADIKAGSQRQSDQVAIDGRFSLSNNHIAAQNAQIYIPTDMVIANLPIPIPVNASGRFKVAVEELTYRENCELLSATGEWLNSGVMGTSGNIPLGNFKADLACQNGDIQIVVAPQNQLGLDATAKLSNKGDISVQGRFRVAPELPREVHDAAQFFGKPDAQGFYQIKF